MTNIDPSSLNQVTGASSYPTTTDVDQGTLLQVLSLQIADTARASLAATMPNATELAQLYGKVSGVGAKLSAANKVVQDNELSSVDSATATLNQVPVHERDSIEVTEADNQRFEELNKWADERDIELEDMTKVIPSEVAGEPPKTVIDVDAVEKNKQILASYRAEVAAGTADNKALRAAIDAVVNELGIAQELEDLGVSGSLETMSDLQAQSQSMLNWAVSTVQHLSQELAKAQTMVTEVAKTYQSLESDADFAAQMDREREAAVELQKTLEEAAEKLDELKSGKLSGSADQIRTAMEDLSDGLTLADRILERMEERNDLTQQRLEKLDKAEQEWIADQVGRWYSNLALDTAGQEPSSIPKAPPLGREHI